MPSGKSEVKFISKTRKIITSLMQESKQRAVLCANIMRNQILQGMAAPHHGKTRRVPGTSRTYTASAPGEYPAIRTGLLRSSVKYYIATARSGKVTVALGSNVEYGEMLEGARGDGLRPWISKAYYEVRPKLQEVLTRRWNV